MTANNQAVMALARELIMDHWHSSGDEWAHHDYGIVRMTARLTGLSESEVAMRIRPDLHWSLRFLVDEFRLDTES